MKKKKIQRLLFCFVFLALIVAEVAIVEKGGETKGLDFVTTSASAYYSGGDGDQGCDDLTNCGSKATCGETGEVEVCTIKCKSGSFIGCPRLPDPE
ncbi:MAG: hypothetical protein FH748_15205 [Balneolaceae bacterium]|nr:hypothetical protein [Balneolaceae bacterium]